MVHAVLRYSSQLDDIASEAGIDFSFVEVLVENNETGLSRTIDAVEWTNRFSLDTPVVTINGDRAFYLDFTRGAFVDAFPLYLVVDGATGEIVGRFNAFSDQDTLLDQLSDIADGYLGVHPGELIEGDENRNILQGTRIRRHTARPRRQRRAQGRPRQRSARRRRGPRHTAGRRRRRHLRDRGWPARPRFHHRRRRQQHSRSPERRTAPARSMSIWAFRRPSARWSSPARPGRSRFAAAPKLRSSWPHTSPWTPTAPRVLSGSRAAHSMIASSSTSRHPRHSRRTSTLAAALVAKRHQGFRRRGR